MDFAITASAFDRVCAAAAAGGKLTLYRRTDGGVEKQVVSFDYPVLTSEPARDGEHLVGTGFYRTLRRYADPEAWQAALKAFRASGVAVIRGRDELESAILSCRFRLFDQLEFHQLLRLQLALVGERVELLCGGRRESFLLDDVAAWTARIVELDPDVIEGAELYDRILPALLAKAKKLHLPPEIGRDGGVPAFRRGSFSAGGRQINCNYYTLPGRHLVDVTVLAKIYDGIHREFEEFSIPALAEYFELTGDEPEIVRQLSDMWLPSYFYRTRLLPMSLQSVILRGNGSALDALLIDGCIRLGRAVPLPDPPESFVGALSRADSSGVFHRVLHCDVRSLYPSILLAKDQAPRKDEAGLFLGYLRQLREFRLAAKDRMRRAADPVERREAEALQSAFKILINSFYGYLGFAQGAFNDYALAAQVTAEGRRIMESMLAYLQSRNCRVIELDTDGIYFQLPESGAENYREELPKILPPGIELEFDLSAPAMFAYKSKNYALLREDGSVSITGAALKSRALEPFQREAIRFVVTALPRGETATIAPYFDRLKADIAARRLPLEKLAKSETLADSTETYRRKLESGKGRRSAAYELLLRAGRRADAGSRVRFYLTGEKAKVAVVDNSCLLDLAPAERNENIAYYTARCDELLAMFQEFIAE